MTSYFWSGFPSLSGRSDVMYGRRHIGGAPPPRHVTPIGSDSCAIVPPISAVRCELARSRAIASILASSSSPRLTSARKRCQRGPVDVIGSRGRLVLGARTKSKLVFDLMTAMRNYASAHTARTHAPQTGPSERAARAAGTFQLLEGITTSVHHLLYLFSAHDHYDRRGKD